MRLYGPLAIGAVALCSASPLLIFNSEQARLSSEASTQSLNPSSIYHLSILQLELLVDQLEDPVELMALLGACMHSFTTLLADPVVLQPPLRRRVTRNLAC